MKIFRTSTTALRALRRNPMRAGLTTLGIIIGVAAVIAMMGIGNGSSAAMQKTIASMGANVLTVLPGAAASGGISFGGGTAMTLSPDDCDAILRECAAVQSAAPIVRVRSQVVYGNRNWIPPSVYGTTPAFLDVRDWGRMAEGEPFSDRDVRNASKVCVLGQTTARELFQGESPIGKEIRIKNVSFRVIGVLSSKGANMVGMDQDDLVLAPWTTIKYRVSGTTVSASQVSSASSATSTAVNSLNQLYPSTGVTLYPVPSSTQAADTPLPVRFANVDMIMAAAPTVRELPVAIRQITSLVRERHRLRADQPDDFNIRDPTEFVGTFNEITNRVTMLLLCVAIISLVVGGIGIMNIMLVSVTERTREIGLRMAVGARSLDILSQFLIEAVLLCMAGGIMGILLGIGSSYLVTQYQGLPTQTSTWAIFASVISSALVGIVFGFYPAWKASRLDPIEALRYE